MSLGIVCTVLDLEKPTVSVDCTKSGTSNSLGGILSTAECTQCCYSYNGSGCHYPVMGVSSC